MNEIAGTRNRMYALPPCPAANPRNTASIACCSCGARLMPLRGGQVDLQPPGGPGDVPVNGRVGDHVQAVPAHRLRPAVQGPLGIGSPLVGRGDDDAFGERFPAEFVEEGIDLPLGQGVLGFVELALNPDVLTGVALTGHQVDTQIGPAITARPVRPSTHFLVLCGQHRVQFEVAHHQPLECGAAFGVRRRGAQRLDHIVDGTHSGVTLLAGVDTAAEIGWRRADGLVLVAAQVRMSPGRCTLEHMFDTSDLSEPDDLAEADEAALVAAISGWAQAESVAAANRLAAIAELVGRKLYDDPAHHKWACDGWDAVAAEVGAACDISHSKASGQMYLASALRERLPKVAALFAAGQLNAALVSAISWHTTLIQDR